MSRTDDIAKVFAKIRDARTMGVFFDEIFTPRERRDIALRWELMKMLRASVPQRAIAAKLGVSLCKITRGAKVLKKHGSISSALLSKGRRAGFPMRTRTAQRNTNRATKT